MKFVANIQFSGVDKKSSEDEPEVQLCNYVDVYKNETIDRSIDFMKATASQREINKFRLESGDILATKDSESPYDIAVPAIVSENFANVLCGYHLAQIKPDKNIVYPSYLFRVFQEKGFNKQFIVNANGITRFGVGTDVFGSAIVSLPPFEEQVFIANFLEQKTSQIDNLIAQKERLLKLLEEKRIALITQAVTKGLNPDVEMKPSGIDWLGDIPEHWNVSQLKRVSDISYGVGGEIDKGLITGTNLLSLPNVTFEGNILLIDEFYCELTEKEKDEVLLQKGDLLFNWRNGSSDHLAKTAIFNLDGEYTHVSFLLRIRLKNGHDSRYFRYLINSLRATGFFSSSKAGVNNTFNLSELSNLFFIVPNYDEQRSISDYLDTELEKTEDLQIIVTEAIESLKEYRISLITSAVTGQIDVRDFKQEQEHEKVH